VAARALLMLSVLTRIRGVKDKREKSTPLQIQKFWRYLTMWVLGSEEGKTLTNEKNDTGISDAKKKAKRPHNGPSDVAPKEWTRPFDAVHRATVQANRKK
jgi:hypothetical protein